MPFLCQKKVKQTERALSDARIFKIPVMPVLQSVFYKLYVRWRELQISLLNQLFGLWASFDRRHRVSDDWFIITYFVRAVLHYGYLVLSHRLNYWYTFEKQVKKHPNSKALVYVSPAIIKGDPSDLSSPQFNIETYTYQELYDIVLRLSYILVNEYNIKPDDSIGIGMHNRPLFVFYWFALWNIGAKPAFLNYNVASHPLAHSMKVSEICQAFIDETTRKGVYFNEDGSESATLKLINSEIPDLSINFVDESSILARITSQDSYQFRLPDNLRNYSDKSWSPGCYIFTSGTTGLPKAAIMSWRKIDLGASLYGRIVRINDKSTVFSAMPLYHSTASILGLLPTLTQGGCIAITDKFSARNFWYQAKVSGASHIQYVGEICRYLLSRPPNPAIETTHNVKVAYGNGLRKDIWGSFKERFHIDAVGEFFASTESPIATTSFQYGDFGIGACRNYGTFINFILSFQQRLVKMDSENPDEIYRDPKDGLSREPKVGEPGQLLFRIMNSKSTYKDFQGYKNDSSETSKKIVTNVFRKNDCWMKTGDLLQKDSYGLFYFVDRLGDTFRWKSENVSTNEVEIQFNESGLVENAVVVGLKVPGYEGRAGYVILKPNLELIEKIEKEAGKADDLIPHNTFTSEMLKTLAHHAQTHLPKYAVPVFVKIVKQYKTTDTHKIIKNYYKNEEFYENETCGKDGEEVYWLTKNEYKRLTKADWQAIVKADIKL
ncbi:long-chain fatty acid transporter [Saccharomycopsis crataegensis]|uniref:Very long-chain fatty acid transport protein n=1 Tax=Saccharomycopsis crataegensis TaxID=43959 RepID=A0AAV5QI17_9ASCO|nr:long-chain fatty acid transporter [Saccharomycopsis crataegensis]